MKRQMILTADDYGFSVERNEGIMEAFTNGAATSASLLLNCTGTQHAIDITKNTNLVLGLHLNLTEGTPIGQKQYKTLTLSGIFRGMLGTREALQSGQIDIKEIEKEINSQIEQFTALCGRKPAYIDGHQHIHLHPVVLPVFVSALRQHGIQVTRLPIEVNLAAKTWLHPQMAHLLDIFVKEARLAEPVLAEHQIRVSDCFTGLSTMGISMTAERLQANILEAFEQAERAQQQGKVVTCELMTHPGHPTPKDYGGFSWGTDDFGNSDDRVHEIQILSSDAMKDFYTRQGIELVSHEKLLQL